MVKIEDYWGIENNEEIKDTKIEAEAYYNDLKMKHDMSIHETYDHHIEPKKKDIIDPVIIPEWDAKALTIKIEGIKDTVVGIHSQAKKVYHDAKHFTYGIESDLEDGLNILSKKNNKPVYSPTRSTLENINTINNMAGLYQQYKSRKLNSTSINNSISNKSSRFINNYKKESNPNNVMFDDAGRPISANSSESDSEKLFSGSFTMKEIIQKMENKSIGYHTLQEYLQVAEQSYFSGNLKQARTYKYYTIILKGVFKIEGTDWNLEYVYEIKAFEMWDFFQSVVFTPVDFKNQNSYRMYNKSKCVNKFEEEINDMKERIIFNNPYELANHSYKVQFGDENNIQSPQPEDGWSHAGNHLVDPIPINDDNSEDEEFEEDIEGDDID